MTSSFDQPARATPLDPDELAGLKIKHITTRQELDRWEQENIDDGMRWIKKRHKSDVLSEAFIKDLHGKMFGKVWAWAGSYRRSGKNIGVDWPQISVHIHQLLQDARYWIENKTYVEDEIAIRFHHRLVWIHPFTNGNGRHARLMADALLEEELQKEPFSWSVPGVEDTDQTRSKYLSALRLADRSDFSELLEFVKR